MLIQINQDVNNYKLAIEIQLCQVLAYFQNYFPSHLLCLWSHLKALTFALQSNQTDYNVHSVAFFSHLRSTN